MTVYILNIERNSTSLLISKTVTLVVKMFVWMLNYTC